MKWFEVLIIIVAIALVIAPIVTHIVKKKNGTLKCECGHLQKDCVNDCGKCKSLIAEINKNKNDLKFKHKYLIHINGMKCGMCESHINDVIRKNFNVNYVKSFRNNNLTIITTNEEIRFDSIDEVIKNEGYDVVSIEKLF